MIIYRDPSCFLSEDFFARFRGRCLKSWDLANDNALKNYLIIIVITCKSIIYFSQKIIFPRQKVKCRLDVFLGKKLSVDPDE